MPLTTGSIVAGKYVLEDPVIIGGQGELWPARDRYSGRRLAIKVFRGHSDHEVNWPRREIKSLQALPPHTHVIPLKDVGDEGGIPFLVTEWIEGHSLKNERQPRLERIQHWCRQICLGLEHCHDHGVYHRDIKPSNVMITTAGDAIIVDFGISRLVHSTRTFPGPPAGTPAYMPPERWRGERGDQRSDLYSFGCLLYELLTGHPPFGPTPDDSEGELLRYKHLNDSPAPPKAVVSGIPDAIDRLTVDLLAKLPAHRPRSAREVLDRLEEIVHPAGEHAPAGDAPAVPHIDPGSVPRLRTADDAVRRALEDYGPDDLRTLEARVERAEQTGRSCDRAGAIRAYDELIPHFVRICGPYDARTLRVGAARMAWMLGKLP